MYDIKLNLREVCLFVLCVSVFNGFLARRVGNCGIIHVERTL